MADLDDITERLNAAQSDHAVLMREAATAITSLRKHARAMSDALIKVRPLGGSELFQKVGEEFYADPDFCSQCIDKLLSDLYEAHCHVVRKSKCIAKLEPALEPRSGIYIASKTRHAAEWRRLRDEGWPIKSTWIDEAGPGESADLNDLWERCIQEAATAELLIIYRDADDAKSEVLKGAWVELGVALASGVPVHAVGINEFTIARSRRIKHFPDIRTALVKGGTT